MKKVFSSFHYNSDVWRVSQIKNIGKFDTNMNLPSNLWDELTLKGDDEIKRWIDDNMCDKDCLVVFIGEETSGRKWIEYEILKAWEMGIGIFGIYIHNLLGHKINQSKKGSNPFNKIIIDNKSLLSIVKCYDPPYTNSGDVYMYICDNIESWIEEAIENSN